MRSIDFRWQSRPNVSKRLPPERWSCDHSKDAGEEEEEEEEQGEDVEKSSTIKCPTRSVSREERVRGIEGKEERDAFEPRGPSCRHLTEGEDDGSPSPREEEDEEEEDEGVEGEGEVWCSSVEALPSCSENVARAWN